VRILFLPGFLRPELKAHLDLFADPGPDGMLFIDEHGTPFSRSILEHRWHKARTTVGLTGDFHTYDLRHTGHTLATQNGATLKDTMIRAGQVSEPAALIYQHSNQQGQQGIADALDHAVQTHRQHHPNSRPAPRGLDTNPK
jgi:integrase